MENRTGSAATPSKTEISYLHANGQADSLGALDLIPWWSFTKTVLAISLLRLSELGTIQLDTPIAGRPFTPAQVLRHEAGLPDYASLTAYHADVAAGLEPWPLDRLLDAVNADRLLFEPGMGWAYSNIGYLLLARLVEEVSNLPLADAMAALVFDRAELTTARLAKSREDLDSVNMGDIAGYHPGWVYHGLVVGTVGDAAKLLNKLLHGKLLAAETLRRMLEPTPLPQFRRADHPDPGYGMGLMLSASDPLHHPIGHTGSGPGSYIAVYCLHGNTCAMWTASSSRLNPESAVLQRITQKQI